MQLISKSNKIIAKNTLYLYARLVFTVIISLISSRLVLKTLGVEDYGIYNLVGGFVALLSILTFSMSGTCQRFIVFELGRGDREKLSETFCTIFILIITASFLFFIIAGLIGCLFITNVFNIPEGKTAISIVVFLCSLALFCVQLLAIPYTSLIIAHEKMSFYAFVSVLESIGKLIIVISLSHVSLNKLIFYALALLGISVCCLCIYRLYCKRFFQESKFYWIFRKNIFKKILSFTLWVGFGTGSGLLKDQGGNILLNLFFGVTLNAACGIANQVKSVVSQLSNNIGFAISPQITKSYSSGDLDRAIKLTFFLAKIQTLLVLLVALPMIFEAPRILHLWLDDVPDYSIDFVRCILVLSVIQTLELSYGPLFLAIGKVKKFQIIASIITLTVLPTTYICYILHFHPITYYIVCICVEIVLFIYGYSFLKKEVDFPLSKFLSNIVLKIIIAIVLTIIFINIISQVTKFVWNDYIQLGTNIMVCLIFFIVFSYLIAFEKKERHMVLEFVKLKLKSRHG